MLHLVCLAEIAENVIMLSDFLFLCRANHDSVCDITSGSFNDADMGNQVDYSEKNPLFKTL